MIVGPIRLVHFVLCFALSYGDSIASSDPGFPSAKLELSLEWGAAALNMTAGLLEQTHLALNGDTPEAAATPLRELSSKLMDTLSGSPTKADAKLARKLGANALKLGAKVLASTEVSDEFVSDSIRSNDSGNHAPEFVADREKAATFPESAAANSNTLNIVGEQRGHRGHHRDPTLDGAFEDNSMATHAQTCSFTLTLSRSNGDKKNFNMQVTSDIDDVFHVQGCSKHGCDGKGFCAHHCIKQGAAGINVIKNQHGKEVGYANCCSDTNAVVHITGCAKAPHNSKLATDLGHRFPSIAEKTVKGAIRRASGDVTLATEELRNLAASRMWDHDRQSLAPATRLRKGSSKAELQEGSQEDPPSSFIDKMREQAQREQPTVEVEA